MVERVKIPGSGQDAVVFAPAGEARHPGVVVLQEWWGVNAQIQRVAQRWSDAGFVAVIPDLFHGKLAANAEEAGALMKALDFTTAVGEIGAAVEHLRAHPRCTGKIVVTGYCLGGALTFATAVATRGLAAAIPYYGLPGARDWSQLDAPVQAHFAQHDEWATVAGAEAIKAAVRVPMELHVYDAQHAFCNDARPEVYAPAAAQLAWTRTLAFARAHAT
jgi:carboxymethylenebutenolidase